MKHLLPAFIVIVFSLILIAGCGGGAVATCPKIGDKAPDFTLPGLDGKNISLSDFSGKPVIINTWSTSCIECKKEFPFFQEIANQYASKGLVILSVNTLDNTATTRDFLSKNGYTFTAVLDMKNDIYKKYCCPKNADPNTFFIGSDGIIKSIKIGGFATKDDLAKEVIKIIN
jgi:peroxiredoxin